MFFYSSYSDVYSTLFSKYSGSLWIILGHSFSEVLKKSQKHVLQHLVATCHPVVIQIKIENFSSRINSQNYKIYKKYEKNN